jgi:dienelactone hydrolase
MVSCCPPGAAPYLAADHADEGVIGQVDSVSYYQVGSGEAGVLLCPDVWGWNGGRTRAIADDLSKLGLSVWVPKVLKAYQGGTDDDGLPPNFNIAERMNELGPLVGGYWNPTVTVAMTLKVVAEMRASGVRRIACIGFCYGAWIGIKFAKETQLVCGAGPHPSIHMEGMVGGNPINLAKESSCPWAFFPCGVTGAEGSDPEIYDASGPLYQALEAKFPGKNLTKRFSTMAHGFVVRGDIRANEFNCGTGEEVKKAVQECVQDIIRYFMDACLVAKAKF